MAQSCPSLCDPMDCSPPGSPLHGILQARIEWVAIPYPFPTCSGGLLDPGIEPKSLTLQADSLPSEPPGRVSVDNIKRLGCTDTASRSSSGSRYMPPPRFFMNSTFFNLGGWRPCICGPFYPGAVFPILGIPTYRDLILFLDDFEGITFLNR